MEVAFDELFGTGPVTGERLYQNPLLVTIEDDSKFLETDIMTYRGYHLVAVHRNPDSERILTELSAPNYRIVPYSMYSTPESRKGYILNFFARVEDNTTLLMDIVLALLEVIVEFQLHDWPLNLLLEAAHHRAR
eukprot:SAG11_NODE_2076_length_3856_cov_15.369178_5_plen_133_part_01